jgi:xanthine dehydrogenase accessory factor
MDVYEELVRLRNLGQKCALATIVEVRGSIPSYESAKLLVREDGSMTGTIGGGCVEAEVWQAAREVMEEEKPRSLTFNLNNNPKYDTGLVCGGTLEIFIEPVLPPAVLYIFGAGHVAYNLYNVATIAGFEVVVVDDRESYANRERFPDAREVIADDFETVTARLGLCEGAYIVIVTRGHRDDMRVLRWAVNAGARYLGMIGSRRKTISIYKELEKEGIPAEKFTKVHAPVGLEIGAVTPEEIAVAIVAEMIAERRHSATNVASKMYSYPTSHTSERDEQDAAEEEPAQKS